MVENEFKYLQEVTKHIQVLPIAVTLVDVTNLVVAKITDERFDLVANSGVLATDTLSGIAAVNLAWAASNESPRVSKIETVLSAAAFTSTLAGNALLRSGDVESMIWGLGLNVGVGVLSVGHTFSLIFRYGKDKLFSQDEIV